MRSERGFTVMETLVGLTLIALILLFETSGRMWAMHQNMVSRYQHNAMVLAQWEVQQAFAAPYQTLCVVSLCTKTTTYAVGIRRFTAVRTVNTNVPQSGTSTVHVAVSGPEGTLYSTDTVIAGVGR